MFRKRTFLFNQHSRCSSALLLHINATAFRNLCHRFSSIIAYGYQIESGIVFHFKLLLQLADQCFNSLFRFVESQ